MEIEDTGVVKTGKYCGNREVISHHCADILVLAYFSVGPLGFGKAYTVHGMSNNVRSRVDRYITE
jgi:hypothetical protein